MNGIQHVPAAQFRADPNQQVYVLLEGQVFGPYTSLQVGQMVKAGTLPPAILYAFPGSQAWHPLPADVQALAPVATGAELAAAALAATTTAVPATRVYRAPRREGSDFGKGFAIAMGVLVAMIVFCLAMSFAGGFIDGCMRAINRVN